MMRDLSRRARIYLGARYVLRLVAPCGSFSDSSSNGYLARLPLRLLPDDEHSSNDLVPSAHAIRWDPIRGQIWTNR